LGLDPEVLFKLDFFEQLDYVDAALRQKIRDENFATQLAYTAVMWNRIEPKDIPPLKDVLQLEDTEPTAKAEEQSTEEMKDVLRTLAARSKRNKTVTRRR
jgi:hypothetical protein